MNFNSIISKLKFYIFPEEWCIAIRETDDGKCLLDDISKPFKIVKNSARYWCADPFLVERDGCAYLFFEMYDRIKRKGLIGYREIQQGKIGRMKVAYECDCHLSYPFVICEDNSVFIIPESNAKNELFRIKAVHFPDKWEYDLTLAKDVRLTDTTVFEVNGTRYYISQMIDGGYIFDRLDLFYEENGALVQASGNPQKTDINSARCAGKIFEYNGNNIRPSQNCGESYGTEIVFNRIDSIDTTGYSETEIKRISCNDISLKQKNIYRGIHTYNSLNNYEVIDLKLPKRLKLFNILGLIRAFLLKAFKH